ncbi:MAG: glycosyltransferase [Planctomycetota bacterium]
MSGQKVVPNDDTDGSILGLSYSLHWGLSPEELQEMYYAADVYINSAWYEGFGLPTLEAMACGVPVIQVNNQGLDGVVNDRQNCLVVPPQNPRTMAEALEILIKDHKLREHLIKNGLKTASRFSLKNQYGMFVAEFEKILNCKFDDTLVKTTKQELECGTEKDRLKKINSQFQPLISVLVPTYNQAKYLPAALDSLIAQTYGNWEAIVVNDGSTDETPLVMERYAAMDRRIRLFQKENGGVASALNEGLKNTRGEWICWLSSDDLFEPNKLAVHIRAIGRQPEIKFFHSHYYYLDEKTGIKKKVHPNLYKQLPSKEFQTLALFFKNYIHGNSVAIHRSVFDRVGNFNEELRYGQDFDMWLRISALYPSHFINERTCVTRWHAGQTTNGFPEGGFYDSCRACIEFLNSHKFSESFPLINLTTLDAVEKVLRETLTIALRLDSMMYKCSFNTSLLERLGEWLSRNCPENLKQILKSQLDGMINSAVDSALPEEIKEALLRLQRIEAKDFRFVPHDFSKETAQHTKKLFSAGKLKEAKSLERYLSHIGSGEEETDIRTSTNFSGTKILFYFDRLGNSNSSPAGTVISILNFARAILRDRPDMTIHLTGNLVNRSEQFESFKILPLPLPDKRDKFLAEYDVVFFATHIRYFKGLAKPDGQLWVLYQHCWEADDPVSLAHMNDFDAVICLSELHEACLGNQGIRAEKLVTIPNLIDTDICSPGDISRNNYSIMFAGGLHPHKCINILLDAFRLVRQQVPEAELHIYGDGAMWRGGDEYGNRLKSIKPEGVYFHGYVDNKDMPEIYSKHSILCLPSRLESFGLVTVEAQACGCIPVVHNVGGVAATLAHEQTGLLYQPNTAEKLAEAIVKAITAVDNDSSVRQRAVDFVRDNFSMTRAAEYISELWDRLAVAGEINAVKVLFESNDVEKASIGCKQLLQKYADQPDLLLLQALIVLRQGDKERCKSMLLSLVEKFGHHQMALSNLGVLLMNEGNCSEALEYFVKAYNVNLCDKNTTLNCGTAWKICGHYKEARMVLFNYLIKVGEDAEVLHLLEEINNLIGDTASGVDIISRREKSIGEHGAGDGLTVMPYYELAESDPLVSVIMPVYNCGRYIGEAIESVMIQSYPKFELIIVDDGSTDNTKEEILRYDDERITYIHQENRGPSGARNCAIKRAKGQYIMPLDADDMMVPYFITSHLKEFEKYPEADLVYCDVLLIGERGNPIRVMNKPEYQDRRCLIRDLFRSGHPIIPFRLGIRRSVFDKIGLYDETLKVAEDYDMLRRFVKAGLKAHHLREALHIRRMQSDNISRTANIDKARNHFDVVKRFTDTFRYDELFPDVEWEKIAVEGRQLHAKCLAAVTCLALGQAYIKSNLTIYAQTAFGQARSALNECLKMDPGNQQVQQLLRRCEFARAGQAEAVQQAVC